MEEGDWAELKSEKETLGLEEMAGRNGKNREIGLGKVTTSPSCSTAVNSATVY